jgi:hypothetical protein
MFDMTTVDGVIRLRKPRPTRLLASPDGVTLAASGEIALIEFSSGRMTLCFQGPAYIRVVIFSPDAAIDTPARCKPAC